MGYYYTGDYYTRGDGLGSFLGRVGGAIMNVGRAAAPIVSAIMPAAGVAMGSISRIAGSLGIGGQPQMGNPIAPLPVMSPSILTATARSVQSGPFAQINAIPGKFPPLALGGPAGMNALAPSHQPMSGGGAPVRGWRWDPVTQTYKRKGRRMNVLNPRALRRAIGRAHGFARFARKAVTITTTGYRGVRFKKRRCKR